MYAIVSTKSRNTGSEVSLKNKVFLNLEIKLVDITYRLCFKPRLKPFN